jgi:hypothetical protein
MSEPTSYVKISTEERNRKIAEIKAFWKTTLAATPFKEAAPIPKQMYYNSSDPDSRGIYCFKNELSAGDILIEVVNADFVPIETKRCIHILKQNPDFLTEYVATGSYDSYVVPLSKLTLLITAREPESTPEVKANLATLSESLPVSKMFGDNPDCNFADITARDLFAILHQKPVSNKDWINEMVK